MPWFHVSMCGPYVKEITYNYKMFNFDFKNPNRVQYTMPSIHIYGKVDPVTQMQSYLQFKDPVLIIKDGGHQFPSRLTDFDFQTMKRFFQKLYEEKNGNKNGFKIPKKEYITDLEYPHDRVEDFD